jgi:hypothetical protein
MINVKLIFLLASLLLTSYFLLPTSYSLLPTSQAALVVRHGDGTVVTRCVAFSEPSLSGLELLQRSGLTVTIEATDLGQKVCLIAQEGCAYPAEPCFCQCDGTQSTCNYWTYWHLLNGQWRFAIGGAGSYQVKAGMVDGWNWGGGQAALPATSFADICGPTPTPQLIYLPLINQKLEIGNWELEIVN